MDKQIEEAYKLLKWAAAEFEQHDISADNWYADFEMWSLDIATPTPPAGQVEAVARAFHNAYEDAAVKHGWKTQESCRVNFDDLPEANRLTMLDATAFAIKASGAEHIAGLVAKNEELRDALLDMVWQFCSRNDKLAHSFMSAEEHAFDVLDLDNGMTYEEAEAASKEAALPPELRGK